MYVYIWNVHLWSLIEKKNRLYKEMKVSWFMSITLSLCPFTNEIINEKWLRPPPIKKKNNAEVVKREIYIELLPKRE